MGPSCKLNWAFARHCSRALCFEDLGELLLVEIRRLGFSYFHCCSHVRLDRTVQDAIHMHNYPASWVERYNKAKFHSRDPVITIGRNFALPFSWEDPAFLALLEPDQAAIMEEAASHGLRHGFTIPLHGPGRYSASCSLVAETPEVDPERVFMAHRFAAYAYEAARELVGHIEGRRPILLSRRERECLKLVAIGKDDETIAIILGISPETVRQYIDSAKQRLNTTKRPHAVAYALHTEAINIEDLFGA